MDALGAPPGADECGESRDYHDYRQANADSRQRKAAVDGHMPDIYAVNYVIEHIDYLRYDRWKRELEKQLTDRLSAEKRFIFFHLITPMRTKNEQSNYITALPGCQVGKGKGSPRSV